MNILHPPRSTPQPGHAAQHPPGALGRYKLYLLLEFVLQTQQKCVYRV